MLDCPPTEGWSGWRGTRGAFHGGYESEMLPHELKQSPKDVSGQQRRVPNSCPKQLPKRDLQKGEKHSKGETGLDRDGLPRAPLLSSNQRSMVGRGWCSPVSFLGAYVVLITWGL